MNFFRTVIALCAHFRNYRAVRDLPVTASLKYVTKLIALLSVVALVSYVPRALDLGDEFAHWVDKHFPAFSIRDGKVITDVTQPYRAGNEDFLLLLDTTGKLTQPDPTALQGVLFMADSFVFWIKATNAPNAIVRSQRHSLRGFPDGVVNGDYFRQLIRSFLWVGLPVSLLVVILFGLATSLIQAYLFSLVASLLERNVPHGLALPQLLNIAIHAVTPAAIIFTTYFALRLKGIDLWLVYLIAYGIFLVGASAACRDHSSVAEA
jgi:hypothetical protein